MAARTTGEQMMPLFEKMLADAGIPVRKLPQGVEYHVRSGEEGRYEFYLNCTTEEQTVSDVNGKDLVTDTQITGTLALQGYGVAVVKIV